MSLITPFFPPFAEEKGISVQMVGVIFSANPVGAFMAALALGKIMTEVTNLIQIPSVIE